MTQSLAPHETTWSSGEGEHGRGGSRKHSSNPGKKDSSNRVSNLGSSVFQPLVQKATGGGAPPGNRTRRSNASSLLMAKGNVSALDGIRLELRRLEVVMPTTAKTALNALVGKKSLYKMSEKNHEGKVTGKPASKGFFGRGPLPSKPTELPKGGADLSPPPMPPLGMFGETAPSSFSRGLAKSPTILSMGEAVGPFEGNFPRRSRATNDSSSGALGSRSNERAASHQGTSSSNGPRHLHRHFEESSYSSSSSGIGQFFRRFLRGHRDQGQLPLASLDEGAREGQDTTPTGPSRPRSLGGQEDDRGKVLGPTEGTGPGPPPAPPPPKPPTAAQEGVPPRQRRGEGTQEAPSRKSLAARFGGAKVHPGG